jgi:L-amino acid N-acyltransferase YncA
VPFELVESLEQAMVVRDLRNSCREFMTNNSSEIDREQQTRWFNNHYKKAAEQGTYRLFLFINEEKQPVGYGALSLQDNRLLITECVSPEYRGQGYGKAILAELIAIARSEKREMVAEIWASNAASIALHIRLGFVLTGSELKDGLELQTYILPV